MALWVIPSSTMLLAKDTAPETLIRPCPIMSIRVSTDLEVGRFSSRNLFLYRVMKQWHVFKTMEILQLRFPHWVRNILCENKRVFNIPPSFFPTHQGVFEIPMLVLCEHDAPGKAGKVAVHCIREFAILPFSVFKNSISNQTEKASQVYWIWPWLM